MRESSAAAARCWCSSATVVGSWRLRSPRPKGHLHGNRAQGRDEQRGKQQGVLATAAAAVFGRKQQSKSRHRAYLRPPNSIVVFRWPHSAKKASWTLVSAVPMPMIVSACTRAAARCISASCLRSAMKEETEQQQLAKGAAAREAQTAAIPTSAAQRPARSPSKQDTPHAVGCYGPWRGGVVPERSLSEWVGERTTRTYSAWGSAAAAGLGLLVGTQRSAAQRRTAPHSMRATLVVGMQRSISQHSAA